MSYDLDLGNQLFESEAQPFELVALRGQQVRMRLREEINN